MTQTRRLSALSIFGLICFIAIAVLASLLLWAPPDGKERVQLMQFFGRLHPLAVHLPIALLILVPVIEIVGRNRRFAYLLPSSDFILAVATLSAIAAAALGWSLARSGGYSGSIIVQHMWSGMLVVFGAWLCWALRVSTDSTSPKLYIFGLAVTVGAVCFAGYRGGQLTQGENHLTEYMPAPLAGLLGVSNPLEAPTNSRYGGRGTFYGAHIQPIFAQHCVTCHGRNKHKANLRLDSFEAVMRGGKHGAAIKAGDAKSSEILRRVSLASSDNDFMPPERSPLSPAEIKLIEAWVTSGASGTAPAGAINNVAVNDLKAPVQVTFPDIDPVSVEKQRASLEPVVAKLQQQLPNVVEYQSRGTSDLAVNAGWFKSQFGDSQLAALSPLAEHIVAADFSGTSITDRSANGIGAMKRLRVLRLMHTRITDSGVQALASLSELETLNLFDTRVTSTSLDVLARLPGLKHIYVGQTKIPAGGSVPDTLKQKLVF